MIYDAFISYSHRDMQWAKWLQHRLETFSLPKDIEAEAKGAFADEPEPGTAPGKRRLRVFRDQTDLTGAELEKALQKNLRESEYLVVLCSPAAAASPWVDEEIRFFQSIGRGDCIIPFIVSGEPETDKPELECYPPSFRNRETHMLGSNVQELGKNKAFIKLVATLLDIRFDRLIDREKQRRRKRILISCAAAAIILAITGTLVWRNVVMARRNQVLSYDIYGAAILSISEKDVIEPDDVAFLETSARAGNPNAMVLLADCYEKGWGTEADPEKAFYWYQQAGEHGDPVGMIGVSNCYSNGTGTEHDEEKALEWSRKAAEAGNSSGMVNVAIFYEEGLGVEADAKEAFGWYKRAAEAGNDLGMYHLARCYRDGIGTEADIEEAFAWMQKLAETGNTIGMYNLGLMYQHGYGTAESPEDAYYWYRKAADAGDADGMYMTGWCIDNNYGIDDLALDWYQRAADLGNEQAAEAVRQRE